MIKNVLQMLEESAVNYKENIAFKDPDKSITFGQLVESARKAGSYFIDNGFMDAKLGERSVLFYMEKSVDALVAMFGGIYCNAFYCFVDVRQTEKRAAHIISLVEPSVIITDDKNQDMLKEILTSGELDYSERIINIRDLMKSIDTPDFKINVSALLENRESFYDRLPLYVNFTSGSTGLPKGVAVGHSSVVEFIDTFTNTFSIDNEDIIANQAPFDFDVSVKDIYSGLYTGAQVVLIPRDYFSNPTILMDYLCDNNVTTLIWAVTAMCFISIMNGFGYKIPEKINKVMFSGEVMPVKHLNKWKSYLPDAIYVNLYGPTEITCNCTYHILDRDYEKDEVIPIGRAFINENVFLLDDEDMLIDKPDLEGEICVSGSCLALGYFKDKEKTEKAFMQNPLNDKYIELIYRTGDLGKYDKDGLLYYTSRKDFQIKHMGQRVELTDIEVSAMSIDGVQRACCLYDHKKSKIIMFYVGSVDKGDLADSMRKKLPVFMLPSKTICLEEMPVNKNGKIDRKALEELY